MQIIAANKKATFDYFINEKFEAGLVLTGSEVKSLRINTGSIKESFIVEKEGELWLTNCYIKKYSSSNEPINNTTRERKILVNILFPFRRLLKLFPINFLTYQQSF